MIRNTDLEHFHRRIDGHINLAGVLSNDKYLPDIIRSCRLKPIAIFDAKFDFGTRPVKTWVDEFGYAISADKNDVAIHRNDMTNQIVSTDLFFGRSLRRTSTASKLIFVGMNEDSSHVLCYGRDDYFRAFRVNDRTEKISPLTFGLAALRLVFKNINTGTIKEFGKEETNLFDRSVIFPFPTKQDISSCLSQRIIKEINE